MNYSVSLLTTRPDCQALIDIATTDKRGLLYRREGLERNSQSATLNAAETEAELTAVTADIASLEAVINGLPDGPTRDVLILRYKKADVKKTLLEGRKEKYGVLSLLQRENDIACIDQDVIEIDAFITALTDRMNAL
jgi:hypothetical protein